MHYTMPMRDILVSAPGRLAWGTTYLITTEMLPPERPLLVAALRTLRVGLGLLTVMRRLPHGNMLSCSSVACNTARFTSLLKRSS